MVTNCSFNRLMIRIAGCLKIIYVFESNGKSSGAMMLNSNPTPVQILVDIKNNWIALNYFDFLGLILASATAMIYRVVNIDIGNSKLCQC